MPEKYSTEEVEKKGPELPKDPSEDPKDPSGEPKDPNENSNEDPNEDPSEDPSDDDGPTREELLSERKKLRAEAANFRTKLREREKQLKEAKSLDEVEALVAEMTAEREAESRNLIRENVALKFNLPSDLADALKGDSREELEAHAKVLSKYAPAPSSGGTPRGGLDPQDDSDEQDLEAAVAAARKARRRGY